MTKRIITFAELSAQFETDPFEAVRSAAKLHQTINELRYEVSAIAYGYALHLVNNETDLKRFYREPFWEGASYTRNPDKLLLHTHQYTYNGKKGREQKRASDHSRALRGAFHLGLPFEDIITYIKENGGFGGLLEKAGASEDASSLATDERQITTSGRVADIRRHEAAKQDSADSLSSSEPASAKGQTGACSTKRGPSLPRMTMSEVAKHLLIKPSPSQLTEILESPVGTTTHFSIIRGEDQADGFKTFTIERFRVGR